MPGLARVGDKSAKEELEDGWWEEAPCLGPGAQTVFCEGKPVALLGDKWGTRVRIKLEPVMDEETGQQKVDEKTGELVWKEVKAGSESCKKIEEASSTVYCEGTPVAREGDKLTCGTIGSGSKTTFAN